MRAPHALLAGAGTAALVSAALRRAPLLRRTNYRGAPVSLAAGPAVAVGALAGSTDLPTGAVAAAALGAAMVGAYDDTVGARPGQAADKGVRGHLAALREGRISAGAVKVVGVGLAGLVAATRLPPRPPVDMLLGGALVAGTANLLNLLDLRPGRALKAGLAGALVLSQPGLAGAAAALLPGDLGERTMLGDTGANALGAVLGLALADALPTRARTAAALAVVVALTGASELVSYSRVIDAAPPLRWLDRLGRRG